MPRKRHNQKIRAKAKQADTTPVSYRRYAGVFLISIIAGAAIGSYEKIPFMFSPPVSALKSAPIPILSPTPSSPQPSAVVASSTLKQTPFPATAYPVPSNTSTTYTYYQNALGKNSQLLQSDGEWTYAYDANGNMASKGKVGKTFTYGWDEDNQLVEIKEDGATISRYFYDFRGNRVKKIENGVETSYLYSGSKIVAETTNGETTFYVHGQGVDEPFYSVKNGVRSFYYPDGLGSIKKVKNATQENTYIYDVHGQIAHADASIPNPFGYAGREFTNTDLQSNRDRYYQPRIGRFVSPDPLNLEGGINQYAYVSNDPVNFTDPFGHAKVRFQGNCNGHEKTFQRIANEIEQELKKGKCPKDTQIRNNMLTNLNNLTIECKDIPGYCGETWTTAGQISGKITLNANRIMKSTCGLTPTIFHELTHAAGCKSEGVAKGCTNACYPMLSQGTYSAGGKADDCKWCDCKQ